MAYINWNDSFSVGNPVIDSQHKNLVDLVNELHDAMKAGKGQDSLSHVYASLIEYIEMHFRTEEAMFGVTEYPHKEMHVNEHKKLMEEAYELKAKFEDGGKFLTIETLNFVRDWVLHHIKVTDMGYRDFI
jgi:hemerythrin